MTEKTEAEKTQIMKEEVEEPSIKYRGWKAMPYVIGNETFEKLGTLGTSSNLLVYLTTVFHMQSVTATTLLQVFNGTTNLAPVFGAFLSDTFFGRYWTLGVASVSSLLVRTFIEKAAILATTDELNPDGSATNPWLLCTLQQVEEVKCLLRIMPIWSAGILYSVATFTNSSYVVFSALQSNRHIFNTSFEIPAGSFTVFSMLALSIWIPIYDQIIVPKLQRVTKKGGGITLLQRIGVGILMSIIGMIVAALVEQRRRSFANSRISGDISSMSSLWLVPQLTIIGISEGFSMIGQVEFYYKQFPENMRSGAGSLVFLGGAAGNYLSGLIITVIHRATGGDGKRNWLDEDLNKGRLDYFYFLIAVIGGMNFMYFIACARWYRYKNSDTEMEISLEEKKTNDALV
ncbi:uncharacterized protein A4U43_C07F35750 [Asparagus officinalis]|uniref:Major facilitator superfamily (MFS) profile domain-containing protein n=1 Tax=Asparagus officinalis TaxID=4686 RepID=A0A5P1EHP1_ASPOF|nr:uncharacterized protein A4U43_C07F35750 [Asparagus officinalis]